MKIITPWFYVLINGFCDEKMSSRQFYFRAGTLYRCVSFQLLVVLLFHSHYFSVFLRAEWMALSRRFLLRTSIVNVSVSGLLCVCINSSPDEIVTFIFYLFLKSSRKSLNDKLNSSGSSVTPGGHKP